MMDINVNVISIKLFSKTIV